MTEPITAFVCKSPGMVNGDITVMAVFKYEGKPYFKATQPIGSLFGQEVHGELSGYGRTRELALENLAQERRNLYESLWY